MSGGEVPSASSSILAASRTAVGAVPAFRGQRSVRLLLFVLVPILLALIAGMGSGLVRLGLDVPSAGRLAGMNHGGLMVSGFIGTVIGLERAVAFGRPIAYTGPLLSAAGALSLVLAPRSEVAPLLFVLSAAALLVLFLAFLQRQFALPLVVMSIGITCWLGGNLSWLLAGWVPRDVVPWWIGFLALTIAGERLELTRFLPLRAPARIALGLAALMAIIGPLTVAFGFTSPGNRMLGLGSVGIGLWLLQHDTARRTFRRGGIASYAGVALLLAYTWLTVTGIALLLTGLEFGAYYDPALHAFFLGFVFGAIFAHAPIILPAVSGMALHFTPLFALGLGLLHLSVMMRVVTGVLELAGPRQVAGLLNVAAILVLGTAVVFGLILGQRDQVNRGA